VRPVTAAKIPRCSQVHDGGRYGTLSAVESSTTRVFETYVEGVLSPALRPGRVVVMDNLVADKSVRVRGPIEERSCELPYLLPYPPELNAIEEAVRQGG
jgi:transposase